MVKYCHQTLQQQFTASLTDDVGAHPDTVLAIHERATNYTSYNMATATMIVEKTKDYITYWSQSPSGLSQVQNSCTGTLVYLEEHLVTPAVALSEA